MPQSRELSNIQNIRNNLWSPILEHYVTFGTFLAAFAAWFGSIKREWKEGLPKRLSVKFYYNNKVVMQCDYAYLSGESDIRQLGQQIGKQICGELLQFNIANIAWKEEPIIYDLSAYNTEVTSFLKFPFRHYTVKYELSSLPKYLSKNYLYIWKPPFDLDEEDLEKPTNDKNKTISLQYSEKIEIK